MKFDTATLIYLYIGVIATMGLMCFSLLRSTVKWIVLAALADLACLFVFHMNFWFIPAFSPYAAIGVLVGYSAFAFLQLYFLRMFGYKAKFNDYYIKEGMIADTTTTTTRFRETEISAGVMNTLHATTKEYTRTDETMWFLETGKKEPEGITGSGRSSDYGRPGDSVVLCGFEHYPETVMFNISRMSDIKETERTTAECFGTGLFYAIPFLGQAVQLFALLFSYIFPVSNTSISGHRRGPWDRRHLILGLTLSVGPLFAIATRSGMQDLLPFFLIYSPYFIMQQFLMRNEKRRFASFLLTKMWSDAADKNKEASKSTAAVA